MDRYYMDKAYEQAIGFMRIEGGENPLDRTGIHPESYETAEKILEKILYQTYIYDTNLLTLWLILLCFIPFHLLIRFTHLFSLLSSCAYISLISVSR